ncbi:MAG: hypothetical protein ABSE40_01345 [Candidatus Sulfotelmatobacter sp.]|jgi:hypothetical protein
MSARRLLVIGLVAVVCITLVLTYRKRQELPRTLKTDDLLQSLASEAVDGAQRHDHVNLDYTVESLKTVDEILEQAHEAYLRNPNSVSVSGLSSTYGAYVGEVIRRNERRTRWERDDSPRGQMSYPLVWGPARLHAYPLEWCRERILNGDKFSVWSEYSQTKQLASNGIL